MIRSRHRRLCPLLAVLLLASGLANWPARADEHSADAAPSGGQPATASDPAAAPAQAADVAAGSAGNPAKSATESGSPATRSAESPVDPAVDRLLTRLEDRRVRDVRARVNWSRQYVVDIDSKPETRLGEIHYRDGEPTPKFLVRFEKLIHPSGRVDALNEKHMFDGEYYVEMQARDQTRTITRTQVRRPDDKSNPFRIGEGHFPLPWGQRKADILREYEVALQDEDPALANHDRVRLTPRKNTRGYTRHRWVDFWIARSGDAAGLPVQVRVAEMDPTGAFNAVLTVRFDEPRINSGISDSVFRIEKPAGESGWIEEVVPLREPAPTSATPPK
ncbi:MAG: hypothetical protein IPM64_02295 [Phycisphaerales bacterium]|nr:hypothetical protein [Phycisphaerales bacterium]